MPLVIGAVIFAIMMTWKRGREILSERFREQLLPLADFYDLLAVERARARAGLLPCS